MTLRLIIPVTGQDGGTSLGAIMMSIDVGGIASYYRNTLWVNNEGQFLQQARPDAPKGDAFARFQTFSNGRNMVVEFRLDDDGISLLFERYKFRKQAA